MPDPAQLAWVTRVLGFAAPQPDISGSPHAIRAAIAGWRAASETVDAQVSLLQSLLQRSDDPELREIGEYGMAALAGAPAALPRNSVGIWPATRRCAASTKTRSACM